MNLNKSLLYRLFLIMVLLGESTVSYAGFFDTLRMALGGSSIVFVEPPISQDMVNYRNLIIQPASSKTTDPLLSMLEANLTSLRINQAIYFKQVTLTPPSAELLKEQKWAVIEISTGQWATNETVGSETRTQCPKGKFTCKNSEAAHQTVSCRTRTASVSAKLVIRDAVTKATLVSDVASENTESKACQDSSGTPDAPEVLLGRAASSVVSKLVAKFTPITKKQPLELVEDDSSLPEASEQLKQAYRLAAGGNVQTALKIYNKLIAENKSNGAVLFNSAYCEHAQGHYKVALELYKKANGAPNAPKDMIDKFQLIASDLVAAGIDSATD